MRKQQEAASEAVRDGTDTVHKWNHVGFLLIPSSSHKILIRNQNTRPACAMFLYLIQSEFQTLDEHVAVATYLNSNMKLLISSAAFRTLSRLTQIHQEKKKQQRFGSSWSKYLLGKTAKLSQATEVCLATERIHKTY